MDIIYHNDTTGSSEKSVDISTVSQENIESLFNQFSEGSKPLEDCLTTIYNAGISTRACCKGNHLEIVGTDDDIKDIMINSPAYIMFESSDFKNFLSSDIIQDLFVEIGGNYIYHYGENHDTFFNMLQNSFTTGRKNNKEAIYEKENKFNDDLKRVLNQKSLLFAMQKNGFSQGEINNALSILERIQNLLNYEGDDSEILKIHNDLVQQYKDILKSHVLMERYKSSHIEITDNNMTR